MWDLTLPEGQPDHHGAGLVVGNVSAYFSVNNKNAIDDDAPFALLSDARMVDGNSIHYYPTHNTTTITSETDVLKNTLSTYGSPFLLILLLFCWARQRYPRVYNLRNGWVKDRQTDLADNRYGFFSWMWQLYVISDEKMMDECGMDSVCFVRICTMGFKLCLVGMLCGCFLMPIYATAPPYHVGPTKHNVTTTDMIVEWTTAHLPPGSPRLISTALAAYIFFGFAMWLILTELEDWFIPMRHRFLMKFQARNYAVFVRNIPPEYQSNRGLEAFFATCLGVPNNTMEAHIGLTSKKLKRAVEERDETLQKLEHALAENERFGMTPTHTVKVGLVYIPGLFGGETVDSIPFYARELAEQNKDIAERIEHLERIAEQPLSVEATAQSTEEYYGIAESGGEDVGLLEFVRSSAATAASTVQEGATAITAGTTDLVASAATQAINLVSAGEDGRKLSGGFVVFRKLALVQAALQMIHHGKRFYSFLFAPYTVQRLSLSIK